MHAGLILLSVLSADPGNRILVMDVKPRVGVRADLAQGITDDVVAETRKRRPHATVLGSEDIRNMVGLVQQKQKLGCANVSCLAEIGGSLGASIMLTGTLARFGSTYLLTLQIVDVQKAKVLREYSDKLSEKSDEQLLDAVAKAVETLLPEEAPPPAPTPVPAPAVAVQAPEHVATVAPPARFHALQWVLIGTGAVAAGVAVGSGIVVLNYLGLNSQLGSGQVPPNTTLASAQSQRATANTWATVGLALTAVAIGCGVGAAVSW